MSAWLSIIVDRMPEPVVTLDAGGRVLAANEAAWALSRLFERSAGADGADLFDLRDADGGVVAGEDQPATRALRANERVEETGLALHAPDGRVVPVTITATPVKSDDGAPLGVMASYKETGSLEEADRLREEWRSVVSHDLRGPVVTVDLASRLLQDEPAIIQSPEASGLVDRIARAAASLDDMIQNLTDSVLVESGRIRLDRQPVDFSEILEDAVESARIPSDRALVTTLEPSLPEVSGDPDRLARALENILRNAVKFGDPGTPIELNVASRDAEVLVSVANRGAEIPAEDEPRIFERFFRGKTAPKTGASGLGLGLLVVKGLVEAHGGSIWVERDDSDRTVFHFTTPAAPR